MKRELFCLIFIFVLLATVVQAKEKLVVFRETLTFEGDASTAAQEILKQEASYSTADYAVLFLVVESGNHKEIQVAYTEPFPLSNDELRQLLFTPEILVLLRQDNKIFAFDLMELTLEDALDIGSSQAQPVLCNYNKVCDSYESRMTCPSDCALAENQFCRILLDGYCDSTCKGDLDCKCGDGTCNYFESGFSCPKDCPPLDKNYYCSLIRDNVCDTSCFLGDIDCKTFK